MPLTGSGPRLPILAGVLVLATILGASSAWLWRTWSDHEARLAALPALRLTDLDGRAWSLADWRGKVVLINFWAGWCAPCIDELPLLMQAQADFGPRGVQVVGPALDEPDAIRALAKRFALNYPVMANFAEVEAAMRAFGNDQQALPFSILIDRDGQVVRRILGGLRAETLRKMLEEQLDS